MPQDWLSKQTEQFQNELFQGEHFVENHISRDINGNLWWWDETEADGYGPFDNLEECRLNLNAYFAAL